MSETYEEDVRIRNERGKQKSKDTRKLKAIAPRMVITKHSLSKKKVISIKGKSRQVVVSKKSRKNDAPDGSDASDIENSSEDSLGSTRGFSPIGFLMVFCSSGLEPSVTGSDSVKRKVIEFIEKKYEKQCTSKKLWQELENRDRSMVLRQLNISWSKSFNSS